MTHGSLFSGIGGFDLAAEWMGWENLFHCEWNPFGQKVLHHYWPNAQQFTDITKTDFKPYANRIDILTGGFPCQPYSQAGKRLGKEDDRHLWPEMLRAIEEIHPRWIVGENVFGLVNWSGGLVFHEVQADLEAAGYEVWPYVLPAAAVNAPHRRDRVWFVAYAASNGYTNRYKEAGKQIGGSQSRWMQQPSGMGRERDVTNTDSINRWRIECKYNKPQGETFRESTQNCNGNGDASDTRHEQLQGSKFNGSTRSTRQAKTNGRQFSRPVRSTWQNFPTQSPICLRNDGIPTELDGITFSKWRNESIKAAGNAIVPQVVFQIFKTIADYDRQTTKA
jgi:DNA (cytosine-5)-methyltransferase 1